MLKQCLSSFQKQKAARVNFFKIVEIFIKISTNVVKTDLKKENRENHWKRR